MRRLLYTTVSTATVDGRRVCDINPERSLHAPSALKAVKSSLLLWLLWHAMSLDSNRAAACILNKNSFLTNVNNHY